MARKARGAYARARPKGGPGMTLKADPFDNWKPSLAPLKVTPEIQAGERGGAQLVNPRAGDLERRYKRTDDRFRAGVYVRSLMERAAGSGPSTILRVLEAAEVGDAALEKRVPARTISDARADAMHELSIIARLVGRRAYSVLCQWFMDGKTLTEIEQAANWRARSATVYADGALQDVADWKSGKTRACSLRSDSVESDQPRKTAIRS